MTREEADKLIQTINDQVEEPTGVWTPWSGGDCPVSPGTIVDVRFRDGSKHYGEPADNWHWSHTTYPGDIVAYCVVEKDQEPGRPPIPGYYLVWNNTTTKLVRYWTGYGWSYSTEDDEAHLYDYWQHWDWLPAPRHDVPKWANQWVVWDDGSSEWKELQSEVGDMYQDGRTIVHVEDR